MDGPANVLREWLTSIDRISVRGVVGPAGIGKTRLALEICEFSDRAGWHAGFVTGQELARFRQQGNAAAWTWSNDTLVVIDYAAAKSEALREWFLELTHNAVATKRLRILLLERHADVSRGWWQALSTPNSFADEGLTDLFAGSDPISLEVAASPQDARALLSAAVGEAARLSRRNGAAVVPPAGNDTQFDKHLDDATKSPNPLTLIMAAVVSVQEGKISLLSLSRNEMANRLASAERDRLAKFGNDLPFNHNLLLFLATGVTLANGYSRDKLRSFVKKEARALGYAAAEPETCVAALSEALGVSDGIVQPVLPHLIAEAAVLQQLSPLAPDDQLRFVTRWFQRKPNAVTATLARIAQDYTDDNAPVRWLTALVDEVKDVELLLSLSSALPDGSPRLANVTMRLHKTLKASLGPGGKGHPLWTTLAVIDCDSKLAIACAESGDYDNALALFTELITLHRDLVLFPEDVAVERNPWRMREMALAFTRLSNALAGVGRNTDSLHSAEDSVRLYRKLARVIPDGVVYQFGTALINLSSAYFDVGRFDEAAVTSTEAVDLLIANHCGDGAWLDFAMALSNLGIHRLAQGRHKEAIEAISASVAEYRAIVANSPDRGRVGLAMALSNQAVILGRVNRDEDALFAGSEAAEIYRNLSADQPIVFLPNVVRVLRLSSEWSVKLGRLDDARNSIHEAIEACEELRLSAPELYRSEYYGLLAKMGNLSVAFDDPVECTKWFDQAVTALRDQSWRSSASLTLKLAMALTDLAMSQYDSNRREDALGSIEEALTTLAPAFLDNPLENGHWMNVILQCYTGLCLVTDRGSSEAVESTASTVANRLIAEGMGESFYALSAMFIGFGPELFPRTIKTRGVRTMRAYASMMVHQE
jgi:tetratricopeptide (TPR) repeat protein